MKTLVIALGMTLGLVAPQCVSAQEPPKAAEPTKEHAWLHQFVGEWEVESEGTTGPGQPPLKGKGTLRARKLGEFWVVLEMDAEMQGMRVSAVQTLGYDAKTKKYVGTWVDSMMDHMWTYVGSVDAEGKTLTIEADGPNMLSDGKMTKYRDVYEFKSKDQIAQTSSMLGDDGKWITFMTGTARRKK